MVSKEMMQLVFQAIDAGSLEKYYNPFRFTVLCKTEWYSKNEKYRIVATAWNSLEKSPDINVYSDKGRGVYEYARAQNLPKYVLRKKEEMHQEILAKWYEQRDYLFYTLHSKIQ